MARHPVAKHDSCSRASEGVFPGGPIGDFSRAWPKGVYRGATLLKIHFTNAKTKRRTFFY